METLEIERRSWLNGLVCEKQDRHSLLRASTDGRMCCLGFYMRHLGYSEEAITDFPEPCSVDLAADDELLTIPVDGGRHIGHPCHIEQLMLINDMKDIEEEERERRIHDLFARYACIEVTFTGDLLKEDA